MVPPHCDPGTPPPARQGRSRDELALAERLLAAARRGADVRARKVRRLRAAIKVRVYENDLKLVVAVEKMLGAMAPAAPAAPEARNPKHLPAAPEARNPKHEIRSNFEIPKKK